MVSSSTWDRDIVKRIIDKNLFKPRNDAIFVYRVKLDQTAGGIVLPEVQDHKASRGYAVAAVVIASGPGRFIDLTGQREPTDLEPGDIVIFAAQAGLELGEIIRKELGREIAFEEIRLIRAHDILATFRDRNILRESGE